MVVGSSVVVVGVVVVVATLVGPGLQHIEYNESVSHAKKYICEYYSYRCKTSPWLTPDVWNFRPSDSRILPNIKSFKILPTR